MRVTDTSASLEIFFAKDFTESCYPISNYLSLLFQRVYRGSGFLSSKRMVDNYQKLLKIKLEIREKKVKKIVVSKY